MEVVAADGESLLFQRARMLRLFSCVSPRSVRSLRKNQLASPFHFRFGFSMSIRFPLAELAISTLSRRSRVSSFFADITQKIARRL